MVGIKLYLSRVEPFRTFSPTVVRHEGVRRHRLRWAAGAATAKGHCRERERTRWSSQAVLQVCQASLWLLHSPIYGKICLLES